MDGIACFWPHSFGYGSDLGKPSGSIAQALGYVAGYFTAPRIPLPPEEAVVSMVEQFSNLEAVPVVPMKTHRAVREAARCHACLIHPPGVPAAHDADIETLQEWLA